MKNFDLEAAKRGAAVCTRDGRNARIIAFDCKGSGRKPILALIDMGDWEQRASHTERGEIVEDFKNASDLMMCDDDYLEKLERGEYGNHIEDKREMGDPAIKQNLNTGLSRGQIALEVAKILLPGKYIAIIGEKPQRCAAEIVAFVDALIAELEKDEKVL